MSGLALGIVSGGQLGRMTTEAAKPMGVDVVVLDPGAECPAWQAGAEQIQAPLDDEEALHELASRVNVITCEVEHVDADTLDVLPVPVSPSPRTFAIIRDKFVQKSHLVKHGIPVADFCRIDGASDFHEAFTRFGSMIVKQRFGGFDGRGNLTVTGPDWESVASRFEDKPLYAERIVPFQKELAVIVARDVRGQVVSYPVVETIHANTEAGGKICHTVLSPPDIDPRIQRDAEEVAREAVRHLDGAGIFGVEMFLTEGDEIMANEIAPRPHNSGHLTMEGNKTSQFAQHVRTVMGWPLGSVERTAPAAVMINILGERNGPVELRGQESALAHPDTHLHIYGKSPTKQDRKMGHVTGLGPTVEVARNRAALARLAISI